MLSNILKSVKIKIILIFFKFITIILDQFNWINKLREIWENFRALCKDLNLETKIDHRSWLF